MGVAEAPAGVGVRGSAILTGCVVVLLLITARVFSVMRRAIDSGEMHHVAGSMSAKTGCAPTYVIGAALAIFRFRGRRLIVVLINAFFCLPPVVVGLALYLALSRSGPLGSFALLFTPTAMVIAQAILATPIIMTLVHRASERAWGRYGDELISDGATRLQAVPQILMIIRADPS